MLNLSYVDKDLHTVDEWRQKFNRLKDNVQELINSQGNPDDLLARGVDPETGEIWVPDSVAAALAFTVNENTDNENNGHTAVVYEDFNLSDFGDLVGFINDTNHDFKDIVGELSDLNTEEKTTFVDAINWLVHQIDSTATSGVDIGEETFVGLINKLSEKIGDHTLNLADLTVIISTINLIVAKFGGAGDVLDLSNLATPVKTNFIESINSLLSIIETGFEHRDEVRISFDGFDDDKSATLVEKLNKAYSTLGNLSAFRTEAKDDSVTPINEIHDEIGDPKDLNTLKKDTIVDAINEKHHWKWVKNNPRSNQITYDDDVHILNSGTVLMIDEEYDFWQVSGYREKYKVWVKSSEQRKYKEWQESGYWKYWNVTTPSGYYKNVTVKTPSYSWTTQKVTTHWNYHHHNVYDAGYGHGHIMQSKCLTPSEFVSVRDAIWRVHLNNGWTGPLGYGGRGWGNHAKHRIYFHKWSPCRYKDRSVRTVKYTYSTKRVWVDTSTTKKHQQWINTSSWVTKTKTVDTSHWEDKTRWIDTSKWVKKTRSVPMPDLPETGLYIDGNVKADKFTYINTKVRMNSSFYKQRYREFVKTDLFSGHRYLDLIGNVTGDVQGTLYGNVTGTSSNWEKARRIDLASNSSKDGISAVWLVDGQADKTFKVEGQLPYKAEVHNHDSQYLGINDSRQVFKANVATNQTVTSAWETVVALAGATEVATWEIGQLVVLIAPNANYTWLKSDGGWMLLATLNTTYTVV